MGTIEKIIERLEKLEKKTDQIQTCTIVNLKIDGGLDDGQLQRVPVSAVLKAICERLDIKPVFKREISFVKYTEEKEV